MSKDMIDIELTRAQAKSAISKIKVGDKWQKIDSWEGRDTCPVCKKYYNQRTTFHTVLSLATGKMLRGEEYICIHCINKENSASKNYVNKMVDALVSQTTTSREKISLQLSNEKNAIDVQAKPYINAGLAEPFALAIARGVDPKQVLNLWKADWWKQYPAEDILISAVLDGKLSEEDGRWLNNIRSDHERLAISCVEKAVTIEWAKALIEAGFDAHPDAVLNVLDGGDPKIIVEIREMKVDQDLLPPSLSGPIIKVDEIESTDSAPSPVVADKFAELELIDILNILDNASIKEIVKDLQPSKSWTRSRRTEWIIEAHRVFSSVSFSSNLTLNQLKEIAKEVSLPGRTTLLSSNARKKKHYTERRRPRDPFRHSEERRSQLLEKLKEMKTSLFAKIDTEISNSEIGKGWLESQGK